MNHRKGDADDALRPRRRRLAAALAVHSALLAWLAFVLALVAGSGSGEGELGEEAAYRFFVVGLGVGAAGWLFLAALLVRWWRRGRRDVAVVPVVWIVIAFFNVWLLPFLVSRHVRAWLSKGFGG